MHGRSAWGVGIGAAGLALLASCTSDDDELIVLAASSLADVMAQFESEFETMNPGVDVAISLAGSNSLLTQVEQGAPADVVAFADTDPMDVLARSGEVDDPVVFASNRLVLATPSDDPGDVDSLDDLADPDRVIGLCAPAVPCGSLAIELLTAVGIEAAPDTEEPDVRSLVAKLVSGELDAGLVYASDAAAFPVGLRVVDVDLGSDVRNLYPIAIVRDSPRRGDAARFVEFVVSDTGAAILTDAGFATP